LTTVTFAHEAEERLRVAFLGTSGHAFRNYLPSLPYAAVDLVALWDPDAARAEAFARQFGAATWYTDVDRLLSETAPDAVLIGVEGFDGDEPLSAGLMRQALEAGCHVWTDKPVAARISTVHDLIALRDKVDRIAAVGAKAMHNPAYLKAREIVHGPEFGTPTTYTGRYPLHIPTRPGLSMADQQRRSCLNHIWHPIGAALLTVGPIDTILVRAAETGSGGVALATFANGAVGTFHFSAGQAHSSLLEHVEIVGEGANVIVNNGSQLTWHRRGPKSPYGRTPSYFTDDGSAPLTWQPELSLGQLYNNNNFMQGYAQSIIAFVDAAMTGRPLQRGTLEDAGEILHVFEELAGLRSDSPATANRK
jgi:predicted dehydrogenase